MKKSFTFAFVLVVSTACWLKEHQGSIVGPQYVRTAAPPSAMFLDYRGRGASNTDWGLALSGGGIRAAAFATGVMKGLYDNGIIDSLDVISAVSGGGYAAYWLYRGELDSGSTRFGQYSFDDRAWDKSICRLGSVGNFQTVSQMLNGAIRRNSFVNYRAAIQRSFGFDDPMDVEPAFDSLDRLPATRSIPYLIHNATVDASARGRLSNQVEIGPRHFGSPSLGMHRWTSTDTLPAWSEIAATAGAAVEPLQHELGNFTTPQHGDSLRAWDGGQSENLAALPLLRRHFANVVIVDAEHDPDYNFEAYLYLRQLLPEEGIKLAIPDIDAFLNQRTARKEAFDVAPVSRGWALHRNGDTTHVWYVKMSRAKQVEALFDETSPAFLAGMAYRANMDGIVHKETGKAWYNCGTLETNWPGFKRETVIYDVARYAHFADQLVAKDIEKRGPNFLRYDFPQTTTVDQSFFVDQYRAFIGLGYLQAGFIQTAGSP